MELKRLNKINNINILLNVNVVIYFVARWYNEISILVNYLQN